MRLTVDITRGNKLFFISDFHLFHKNIIKFDNRPFVDEYAQPDIEYMHETLLKFWNEVVGPKDTVFYMGDLIFGRWEWAKEFVDKLNGKIHFVMGNHDSYDDIKRIGRFETIFDLVDLTVIHPQGKQEIVLCHYPFLIWNKVHNGRFHLHGHCHQSLYKGYPEYYNRKVLDMGCNGWDYTPIDFYEIKSILDKKEIINLDHH